MTYFDQIDPINDIFDHIPVHKPDLNNFYKLLGRKLFQHFPQISTYDVILAPKMTQFLPFSPKMTYFEQINHNNDTFDQSYENKFQQRFDWQKIYMLPRYSCIDSFTHIFQFKILHNILFFK